MRNPLQEQLLKAGLVKKSKVAQVVREQEKQRQGKSAPAIDAEQVDGKRLQAERAERDRALAAERNAQARADELRAQARQIVEQHKLKRDGEIAYGFIDEGKIKRILVDPTLRTQLAKGSVVIVRHGSDGYELVPRAAAEKIHDRDPALIVLDHGKAAPPGAEEAGGEDDDYYQRFPVPDDLVW